MVKIIRISMMICFSNSKLFLAIKRVLVDEKLSMEIIVNHKTNPSGLNVIQLETAVGAAMKCFSGSLGILNYKSIPVGRLDNFIFYRNQCSPQ